MASRGRRRETGGDLSERGSQRAGVYRRRLWMMKRLWIFPLAAALALTSAGCFFRHPKNLNPLAGLPSVQPDRTLYNRAMKDLAHNNFTVARLLLQDLINTYPDSQYLAQAKLAIANSWYREGGSEGLAQAEAQYQDFITFFPNMPEAREAQLRIATIHFRQIQKPDRDPTQALDAKRDLTTFLRRYPTGLMSQQARQMLRETDEVLADGIFRIAQFYEVEGNYRAEQGRLQEVLKSYPLYSRGAEAMAMLAESYLITSSRYSWAEEQSPQGMYRMLFKKNAIGDFSQAQKYLARLIERYPESSYVGWARRELAFYHKPIPTPTPEAIAFNKAEIAGRGKPDRWDRWTGMLRGRPLAELSRADKVGNPLATHPAAGGGENAEIAALTGKPQASAPAGGASGPLAFQPVPTGGFVDPNNVSTPSATTANDLSDAPPGQAGQESVNGQMTSADPPDKDLTTLTPDQLDALQAKQMIAAEVHRNVPVPRKLKHRLRAPAEILHPEIAGKTAKKLKGEPAAPKGNNGAAPAAKPNGGK